jgi:uncharacterized OsmC-like protein
MILRLNKTNLRKNILNKISRNFNFSTIRNYKGTTIIDLNKNEEITNTNDLNMKIKTPMEAMVGLVSACSAHSIMYYAKLEKVHIEKIEIKANADFDVEVFLGKKEGKNTYEKFNLETNIKSNEIDKDKLSHVVEMGKNKCPLLETLKLAGVKIESKINYI